MRHIFHSRQIQTEEAYQATTFEIFFDLVFVFALTRITPLMAQSPTPRDPGVPAGVVVAHLRLAVPRLNEIGWVRSGPAATYATMIESGLDLPHRVAASIVGGWRCLPVGA